jgi:hypothetical protein
MQVTQYSQANTLYGDLVVKDTDAALASSATVTAYLVAVNGTNAGKWFKASDETWSATEASAGSGTYVGGALWSCSVATAAWFSNGTYKVYWKDAGATCKPYSDDVVCPTGASTFIGSAPGVLDVCNMAIALVGGAAGAQIEMLDTIDGTPSDPSAAKTVAWCQLFYPRARNKVLLKLAGPRAKQYIDPGAALDDSSAITNNGWTYCYSRPPSMLKVISVIQQDSHNAQLAAVPNPYVRYYPDQTIPLPQLYSEVPYEEIGGQICCDYESIFVYGVVAEVDVTKWIESTVFAVASELAWEISRVCGAEVGVQQSLHKDAVYAFHEAMADQQSEVYVAPQQVFVDHSLF